MLATKNRTQKRVFSKDSSLSCLVDGFYEKLGRTKISTKKREKGERILQTLVQQNFTEDELGFSLEWLAKHHPDTRSLDRLEHVIDQAIDEYRSQQKNKRKQLELHKQRAVNKQNTEASRQRLKNAETIYKQLSPNQLKQYKKHLQFTPANNFLKRMAIISLIARDTKKAATTPP